MSRLHSTSAIPSFRVENGLVNICQNLDPDMDSIRLDIQIQILTGPKSSGMNLIRLFKLGSDLGHLIASKPFFLK